MGIAVRQKKPMVYALASVSAPASSSFFWEKRLELPEVGEGMAGRTLHSQMIFVLEARDWT